MAPEEAPGRDAERRKHQLRVEDFRREHIGAHHELFAELGHEDVEEPPGHDRETGDVEHARQRLGLRAVEQGRRSKE